MRTVSSERPDVVLTRGAFCLSVWLTECSFLLWPAVTTIFPIENLRKGHLMCKPFIWEFSLDLRFPKGLETDISETVLIPQVLRLFT